MGASEAARRRAIVAGIVVGFAVGSNVANTGAIATSLATAYDISLPVVGLLTTALFITHTASQVPGGQAIDRLGARRLAFVALAVIVASSGVATIAAEPALALVARAIAGVGTGIGFIAGSDYVRAAGGGPLAQGLFGGFGVAGGGFSLAVVPQLEHGVGWRAAFVIPVALGLLAFAVLAVSPLPARDEGGTPVRRATALQVIGDRRLYRIAVMHAAAFGISVVAGNWIVTLLERHGYGTGLASALGALSLGISVVSRPLGGWIVRRHPGCVRPAVAASLAGGAAASIGLAASGPVALAVISSIAIGVAAGIPFAPAFAGAARTRPDAPAAAIGMINMCGGLLIVAATPLVGLTFLLPGAGRIGFVALAVGWAAALLVLPPRRVLGGG
jgi:MFS transporter, NNP family, nitrate/nitrite transporter